MKILKSKKGIPIPTLFFISDRKDIAKVPKGVPYFYASADLEDHVIAMLEYEVLYQKAKSTRYPFDFKSTLSSLGFSSIEDYCDPTVKTSLGLAEKQDVHSNPLSDNCISFRECIINSNYYVDISVIKSLKLFPVWMETLEEAISTNIQNFATFDTNMYNKKLEGMYGGLVLNSPKRNLIIIDISGSIPRNVSETCLLMAQNLSESFYADVMITGSKTTLYTYEEVHKLNVAKIFDENGTDNDQVFFRELLESSERHYENLIVFGDEDSPGHDWSNCYNYDSKRMSDEEGQELNKWTVNKIISFHAMPYPGYMGVKTAAYGRWFKPKEILHIDKWVKDMRGPSY